MQIRAGKEDGIEVMKGIVYLVGAGCGSYDMITLRGLNILRQCDVVVYDNLIDNRLLDFVPADAEKICVGKRSGFHSEKQERINEILVEKASEGRIVVRLKGGDPFVFGRGGEEAAELESHEIPYVIVSGITSAVSVPEFAGIPVTYRELSRSVHIITGKTADNSEDFRKYSLLDGTLVFLMGLSNIRKICNELISGGMSEDTPASVISCGGTENQKTIRGKISNIAEIADKQNMTAPAVIVIGKTAQMDFSSPNLPLKRTTAAVTGTKRFTDKLAAKLMKIGADVKKINLLEISEYRNNNDFDNALRNIENYNWIILTSMNGAEIFLNRMRKLKVDIRRLYGVKFAVIGKGTSQILEKCGIFPNLIPEKHTTAELGKALCREISGEKEKLLILRAGNGSQELSEILKNGKIDFTEISTYEAKPIPENVPKNIVCEDFLIFGSSSGAEAFFSAGGTVSEHTKIICIGEVTAKVLSNRNISNYKISAVQTAEGIIESILQEV